MKLDPLHFRGPAGLLHHAHAFIGGGGGDTAPQRNLTQELEQTLAGYQNTAGGFLGLNQQYQPQYDQLSLQEQQLQQQGFFDANGTYHPGTIGLSQQANTSNRGAALGDLNAYGVPTTASLLGSNPFLAEGLGLQSSAANAAGGPQPLLAGLQDQAAQQLAQNGQLSDAQKRDLSQQTLAGFAANGTANGNQALGADLLSRANAVTQRQQAAQQFAGSVQGLTQGQQQLAGSLAGNYANTASQTLTNPVLQLLGFGNLNPGYSGTGATGTGSTIANANDLFPQFNSYINDIYSSNQNATASQAIANQNNAAAGTNALIGLAGALISDERLKTRVKKTGEETRDGLPIVDFTYKTDPKKRRYRGVMAQDVEEKAPWALLEDPVSGVKAVDYTRLGLSMHEIITGKAAA